MFEWLTGKKVETLKDIRKRNGVGRPPWRGMYRGLEFDNDVPRRRSRQRIHVNAMADKIMAARTHLPIHQRVWKIRDAQKTA
jgi:hypothetical protein